ncbi:MAG TPA: hypothetical protein VKG24_04100 [Pseudolabrys sp.]|nr:hypothetical protein [Pseudolabrys sp.]
MAVVLRDSSFEAALVAIERIIADPDAYNPEFETVEFGPWASIRVRIPEPDLNSVMTPPFMEAFLELQKQVYQFAALIETGVANTQYLSESDILRLQINVKVTDGSSNYVADLALRSNDY